MGIFLSLSFLSVVNSLASRQPCHNQEVNELQVMTMKEKASHGRSPKGRITMDRKATKVPTPPQMYSYFPGKNLQERAGLALSWEKAPSTWHLDLLGGGRSLQVQQQDSSEGHITDIISYSSQTESCVQLPAPWMCIQKKTLHFRVDWTISEHPENSGMHVHLPVMPVTCLLHDTSRIQNLLELDWSSPASHTPH